MRKASAVSLCIIALVALAMWATDVSAFSTYPSCGQCHGGFRTVPYKSLADGQSWASGLHDTHRNTMLSGECNACHIGSSKTPVYLDRSNGGNGLAAIGCTGCHGRDEDMGNDSVSMGRGAGLRQHHYKAGETVCLDCHDDANPANYKSVAENVSPPYYFTPDTAHPNKPTSSCNDSGKENFAASTAGLDNDGDGLYDAADPDCQAAATCIDNDGDGYGSNGAATCAKGTAVDCNDNDPTVNPGAADNTCNGIDENCSGTADEGYVPTNTLCGKGICASTGQLVCQNGTTVDTCTAGTPQIEGPFGSPTCSDAKDNDCNGQTDAADANCAQTCVPTTEVCDGVDNDCDGQIDEGIASTPTTCGVGLCASTGQSTCQGGKMVDTCTAGTPQTEGPAGSSTCSDSLDNDCDGTTDAADASCAQTCVPTTEVCDGVDNDCDGQVDEGIASTPTTCGVGSCASTGQSTCQGGKMVDTCTEGTPQTEGPSGSPTCGDSLDNDCDGTTDAADSSCVQTCVPAAEVCDGVDNNCDGQIDEGVENTYYRDADRDGYGDPSVTKQSCRKPKGYVKDNTDCNDSDRKVKPGARERHDGLDNNCDGQIDEGLLKTYYRDADRDGYGDPSVSIQSYERPQGYVKNNKDCNDSNRKVHEGTAEICGNQVDQGCTDIIDCSNPACYTNPACSNPDDKDHDGDDDSEEKDDDDDFSHNSGMDCIGCHTPHNAITDCMTCHSGLTSR